MSINLATQCNISSLIELVQLLRQMEDDSYRKTTEHSVSSIGAHCRHIIEFYQCFFQGLTLSAIDYDRRQRDLRIEYSRTVAIEELEHLQRQLGELNDTAIPEHLALNAQIDENLPSVCCSSSVIRELLFLQNHSVHHMALISMLLQRYGKSAPATFGLANSTRIYRKSQAIS